MMSSVIVLAAVAVVALFAAGYLFGVRLGKQARAELRANALDQAARIDELSSQLAIRPAPPPPPGADRNVDGLRKDVDSFRDEVRGLFATLAKQSPDPERLNRDLQKALATLVAQRSDGANDVRKMMSEMLAPMLDRERMGHELSTIRVGGQGLGELPRILDLIAERGGFVGLVLSDESGLPLAASSNATDVEALAGTAAYFLTLAERAERASLPRPLSCVVHDETNRLTLHRVFSVGQTRFTLSAVSRGLHLAPGALDPALSPLERVLTRQAS